MSPSSWFRNFATYTTLRLIYGNALHAERETMAKRVTVELIKLMQDEATKAGSKFLVTFLYAPKHPPSYYTSIFEQEHIPWLDCVIKGENLKSLSLPQDEHPNEIPNRYWARCIADFLTNPLSSVNG